MNLNDNKKSSYKITKVVLNSSDSKVNYILDSSEIVFSGEKYYENLFQWLRPLEKKLKCPLDFDVHLDSATVHALYYYAENKDINLLLKELDTRIFALLNDLSLKPSGYKTAYQQFDFLYTESLDDVKDFYDEYSEFIQKRAQSGISSLPLYDALYRLEIPMVMSNILVALNTKSLNPIMKTLACELVLYVNTNFGKLDEIKNKNFLDKLEQIDRKFSKLNDQDVSDFLITNIYRLVNSN